MLFILHHRKTYKEILIFKDMIVREKTRPEIETKLRSMSDFLKMEYLENCLKQQDLAHDVKRFVHQNLALLYEPRSMFSEAAKNMESVADVSVTFKDKIDAFLKVIELYVKAGMFDMADNALRKAMSCANASQRVNIRMNVKEMYKNQAIKYEKIDKPGNAMKIYEKMMALEEDVSAKNEIKRKLLPIYERLGKIREYSTMSRTMS